MESFAYRYDARSVFDDFLTMSLCAVSQNPLTGKSHDEDLYLQTVAKYPKDGFHPDFPKLFALLILEMEDRVSSSTGNDVLGEYFELNFCRKNSGQFFTPWPICQFMAKSVCSHSDASGEDRVLRILDPSCGSGRMLLAGAQTVGRGNEYYGIDIDHTCVKMTALNLFFNGIFHSEVMWGDALLSGDFRMSYKISLLPFGIFRISNKEESRLWHLMQNTDRANRKEAIERKISTPDIKLPSESGEIHSGKVSQLTLF